MKTFRFSKLFLPLVVISFMWSCQTPSKTADNEVVPVIEKKFGETSPALTVSFEAGKAHNHPTFAIWLETPDGKLIQTLFVTRSIGSGFFQYGDAGDGRWLKVPGKSIRPAALPYWVHRRENISEQEAMPTPENPVADAYTGATPTGNFRLSAATKEVLPEKFRLLVEVNQPWDWNKFWSNDKFSEYPNYKTSAQPSLVYAVDVDLNDRMPVYYLNPIGHGAFAGQDGKLYTDISKHTTALEIFKQITLAIDK